MKNLAIVGATGLVGSKFIECLEKSNLEFNNIKFLASERSTSKKIKFKNIDYPIEILKEDSFKNINYAVFVAGSNVSQKYAKIAAKNNVIVIDNSSYFRMDKDVPLIIPEINSKDLKNHNNIIANPNCSTIQALLPLKVLEDNYKIKRIIYTTFQAVSGAGIKGIKDLENNTKEKFKYSIKNNCIPQIDKFLENGYTKEEEKMINETRKILHREDLNITATCVRVPCINCHSESINVELFNDFDLEDLKQKLNKSSGICLLDDIEKEIYPLNTFANNKPDVFVGRVRRDFSKKNCLNMWVVSDNLLKGAAYNALQILEKIYEKN